MTAHLLEISVSLLLTLLFCVFNFVYLISEGLLPRPNYVSTILKNVGSLYHGCMFQPNSVSDSELDNNTFSFLHFEKERRPSKGTVLWAINWKIQLQITVIVCSNLCWEMELSRYKVNKQWPKMPRDYWSQTPNGCSYNICPNLVAL